MKDMCDCYIEDRELVDYTPLMKPIYKTVARCNGTRERDECSCGGDKTECDFYPEVREKAKKEQKESNCLIVTYDCCYPDVPTLCVARQEEDKVRVLNFLYNDEALYAYLWLTGNAELKTISKKEIFIDDNLFPNGYGKYHQRPLEIHFEGEDKR